MFNILCYGDSNTHGTIGGTVERFPREVRWPGRLQLLLGERCHIIEEGLGGRTTVWDDPVEEHKNGRKYLLPCLESHRPLDLVVLVLGTNDLKKRFAVSSFDIGISIETLVKDILHSNCGVGGKAPHLLLIPPVPIRDVGNTDFNRMLEGGFSKSHELAEYYRRIAEKYKIHYLDVSEGIALSAQDGVHYTAEGHRLFAERVCAKMRQILPLPAE